jgi:hypothetical protein
MSVENLSDGGLSSDYSKNDFFFYSLSSHGFLIFAIS